MTDDRRPLFIRGRDIAHSMDRLVAGIIFTV